MIRSPFFLEQEKFCGRGNQILQIDKKTAKFGAEFELEIDKSYKRTMVF